MRGILINAVNRTVEYLELEDGINPIREALDCRTFSVPAYRDNDDAIYADDEGLFDDPQHFVLLGEYPEPIAGNVLLLGTTSDGDSTDCQSSLEDIKREVVFMDLADVVGMYR
jgi:hypothetical protein